MCCFCRICENDDFQVELSELSPAADEKASVSKTMHKFKGIASDVNGYGQEDQNKFFLNKFINKLTVCGSNDYSISEIIPRDGHLALTCTNIMNKYRIGLF